MENQKELYPSNKNLYKQIVTIQSVVEKFFDESVIIYNEEENYVACPICSFYINLPEDSFWSLAPNFSNMDSSIHIFTCLLILKELLENKVAIELCSGDFIHPHPFNDDEVIKIDSADVWEYMALYGVSEEMAVNTLICKELEIINKEEMN